MSLALNISIAISCLWGIWEEKMAYWACWRMCPPCVNHCWSQSRNGQVQVEYIPYSIESLHNGWDIYISCPHFMRHWQGTRGPGERTHFSCRDGYKAVTYSYCLIYLNFQVVPVKKYLWHLLKTARKTLFKGATTIEFRGRGERAGSTLDTRKSGDL